MSDVTDRLAHLSPAKRLLLQKMRREQAQGAEPAIRRRTSDGPVPLSFAQQRLWFIHQMDPQSSAYHLSYPLRLRGALDVPALERSLGDLVARHETLRTVFPEQGGEPVQRILPPAPQRIPVTDLRGLPEGEREAALRRLVAAETQRPFDLAAGPLLRTLLVRPGGEEWVLCFTLHHVVSDGWSTGVLTREITELYRAHTRGEEPALPELPIQYADYAAWQREHLSGERLEAQTGYWRAKLVGAPPLLELPTDFPRRAAESAPGGVHLLRLPAEVARAAREMAQREGASVFMVLLAAWQLLLARYSGQDDVSVGTAIAGRTRRELEGVIGFFVNTLVLRTDLSGDPTFLELLARVRETTLGAYAHQELPFERLVEELAPERSLTHTPLFQVMFSLRNLERGELRLGDVALEPVPAGAEEAQFDLALDLTEGPDGFGAMFTYRTDRFAPATIERMAAHYRRVLEAVAADPSRPVSSIDLLDEAERELLARWSRAEPGHPADACIHDLFRAQASRTPDAPALRWRGETLTYAELDARANRLAHLLRRRGVGPETRVGVCMERAPGMIVSLLAVLRAGGAYVPLDPASPRERLGYVAEDAGVRLVLTGSTLADRLPERVEPIALDRVEDELRTLPEGAPETGVTPENLSYVIFTSGSTGRPKGVMIRHSSTVVLLHWLRENVTDEERGAALASTSISFDVSIAEIFGTLCWGGTLVLVENALELASLPPEEEVRLATMVPTAAAELLRAGGIPRSVRAFNLAGEALPADLARALYALGHVETVRNLYGPTEDTTYSTGWSVERGAERVFIGRPVAGTRAQVLDAGLRPVPVGLVGELYLAGDGLARGYANHPDLTAERFLPDPFGEPGSRMYRVMDRARWNPRGELEYLGRADFQVKVRGFRIEPGEIESVLRTHPGVRDAVALVREETPGEPRLVAYVAAEEGAVDASALRAHVGASLPAYMVPSAVVVLEALPLTPNGKLDRRALPAPAGVSGTEYVAPRTPVEERVAAIFAEVLGAGRVGLRDDFFALGGHSLLAMRVVSRAREAFGVELPVRAVFELRTVEGIAARVEREVPTPAESVAPPEGPRPGDRSVLDRISPERRLLLQKRLLERASARRLEQRIPRRPGAGPAPLSFSQQRLWFIDQLEPGNPTYNLSIPLRLRGPLHAPVLRRALSEIVRRHEALRTVFATHDGEAVQVVRPAEPVAFPLVDLSALPAERREGEARRLAGDDLLHPFDLARGPLLRAALLRLGEDDHAAFFTLHHIVTDGWSLDVLVGELSTLYRAFARGEASPLPELEIQYADYALWQREHLRGEVLEAQLGYWRERLAGAPPLLELPTDRPRPPVAGGEGASRRIAFPAETARALRELAAREGTTLFMTLLAAWQVLLARWSGQEDVSVGTPTAGRTRVELEGLIGFFVNTLVLRTDLSGNPTFREVLARVRESTLGAYQHQDVPFERLVEELAPERSLMHTPLFQVMFSFDSAAPGGGGASSLLEGVQLSALAHGRDVAKFDMHLTVDDRGEHMVCGLVYRAELFEGATIERMLRHFRAAADQLAALPERPVGEVDLLTPTERAQLLEGGLTRREHPRTTVHALFAEQAARTPDAVALRFRGDEITYAELERRANRLAHLLRQRGVGPEAVVGISLPRTPEMVVALLAVLKAGGAYVPLDPAYPQERLGFMLEDSGARLVLTESALADRLPGGAEPVALDRVADELRAHPDDAPESGVDAENLSHVIFTSGSTGRPKGVMIRHSSVVVLLHWLRENVSDEERSAVLGSTSINFDVSIAEIFGTLAWGGTLHLVENALSLAEMGEAGIVYASMVPTAAAELLRMGGIPASVRTLNLGGEALPNDLAQALYRLGTVEKVGNLYGPTEDTTYSTYSRVERGGEQVYVGRPVTNTRAYVLDGELRPVPVGVIGELYLAGDGLARGYARRPELTAERFLPDPFGEPGSRMYRVMDRVRWRSDGELEYFGRTDFQVKVRGFRIELGEIETALRAHPAVRDAVVLVREDTPGDRRLVAYLVAEPGADVPAADELRTHLRRHVPEYMVPGAFVALDQLPLTPNGKVDRRALPAPETTSDAGGYAPPRTPVEASLAEIFGRVLHRENVGIHDSFFDLGGHSLLATRVTSHIREAFGVEVPLRTVFEASTVAALAGQVEALLHAEEGPAAASASTEENHGEVDGAGEKAALDRLSPQRLLLLRKWRMERAAAQRIPRRPGNAPAPLSFAQQRLWFIHQLDPRSSAYNMPFALRLRGTLDVPALRRSLTELVRRHEAVRTAMVDRGGGEAVQVILPATVVPFPAVDLSALAGEQRGVEMLRRVREEGQRPFDLTRGPLLRALLIRLGGEEWALCFTMHHIISDGWSMGVLTREISALYEAYARGGESPLPELEVQYADFAAWQRARLSGEALEKQLAYWRERLAGAPPLLELPTDHPRRSALGVSETGRRFVLSPETTQALRELARVEGATLFMVLLAAWQTLLGRYAGQDDVVVGTPIANRTRAELEPLIGFFVNTLVLRGDLSGDPTFRELLVQARESTLGAYAHQDLPFERLVEELAPERSLMHNPLFQVMFALQNMDQGGLTLGDVDMELLASGDSGAKFDIGVTLTEVDDLVSGRISYRTDLFDESTIERMAEHFHLFLEGATAHPDLPVSRLRIIGPEEEHRLLAEWNAPRAYPTDRLVPHLFAEQARRTPDAPALWDGEAAITYAELDRRSSRLARALRALGVGPETPVGVCLERGPELVLAVLATWKAGGAYVPLDPGYPPERLAYLLQDAAVPVLVSRERLRDALPPHDARLLLLDADAEHVDAEHVDAEHVDAEHVDAEHVDAEHVDAQDDEAPEVEVGPEGLAYVIYTSGSTGRPKGVRIAQRSLLHTLHAAREAFGFAPDDVVPSLASFSFDIWLFEAVLPLLAGGSVRILPREEVLETEQLAETLAGCTALHAVPALMRQIALVLRASGRTLPRLRHVFVGGDAVPPDLLDEMREVFPAAAIHVLYGPTEGTIICASHRALGGGARRQWVGRPLGNASLYVLDRALQPVPTGVPGELCIGGASVARDYLGRPELTAEKFQPDPFAPAEGARMYRTGDRVRWTADGELEFLGRVDTQVKIRGFRIEPGEVENVLLEHPEVQEATVVVREDTPGDRRLVAYVVPAEEGGEGAPQAEFQQEHVQQWESLFGDTYGGHAADEDPAFNIVGWNSSYTGEPIPAEEMREWVEHAADRIRALRPRRVLEIGCGTGLLLFRVAPQTEEYWGADFAATAIDYLERQLARHPLPQVRLLERTADDFTGIPEGHFDLVVINSVAQYFPGVDYLLRVLEGAVASLAPGGRIFLGDLRSFPLLEAFHASVELAGAPDDLPAAQFRDRVRRRVMREKELLLDPELFRALPQRLPRISSVEVRLKRGRHANEMTRFRYDVLLRVESGPTPAAPAWRRWEEGSTLDALRHELEEAAPGVLGIARVPNPRVAGALAALDALRAEDAPASVGGLRAVAGEREAAGVDPEDLAALGESLGYRVQARWSAHGTPGEYDVLLARRGVDATLAEDAATPLPWSAYANNPLARKRSHWLVPELRGWLRERVPEYMVPSALVLLDTLPLTPNGKVDRRALPAPETAAQEEGTERLAPRTQTEEILAGIWAEVLQMERVGIEDDFFALGGHSLLATRVVSRVREAFGVELPLRALFEAPTVARLALRVEDLLRLGAGAQLPPLLPTPRDGRPLPLSFAQQRLWFIHQLEPKSPAYNMPSPLRLRGRLEVATLERALTELVRRHESLRTVFRSVEGEPVQVIHPAGPATIPVVDLRALPGEEREAVVARLAREEMARPFDLARGPLLRATLLRPGEEEWALLFTLHHIVSDGWSMGVLVREISALYQAFAAGAAKPSPLPEPQLQYADYAVWQRGWLQGEVLEAQLAYWRERLAGAPPLLEVPTDHPRPLVASDRAEQRTFALSLEASQALRALSQRQGATLFMTLLAAYQALLARWSGQDDVVVGTPVAGRGRLELEGMIGFFVNMLVVRTRLDGRPTFRELVGRVREGVLGAQSHQDLPFERLVDELHVERSLDRAPLFQAIFALLGAAGSDERLSLGEVQVYPLHSGETTAKFDLSLTLQDGGDRLVGGLVYRADLFEGATIERMLQHFRVLADQLAADPDRAVDEVDLLTPAERTQLLGAGRTRREHPRTTVHALFAEQAARTPDAVALRFRGEDVTYAELERRANRLAHLLRQRGVGPETVVGISLPRTPEMIVALLAVLRAGGAYVPLDPAYPRERLGFMLEDSGARLVLTEHALADRLPEGAEPIALDRVADELRSLPEDAPETEVDPENVSHVIFTSGSTGRPKGVMIRHSSTVVLLHWLRENVTDDERRAVLGSTSINFDVSVAEIFGTLCWGGTLHLVENALSLAEMGEAGIVYASMVPTAAAELLRMGGIPASVRTLNLGGEALPNDLAQALYRLGTVEKVGNLYGPTEDTSYSTYSLVRRGGEQVYVGRPVTNTRAYVLDGELRPVPVGVIGELYLSGDGLARGYANRPDLTAERFLPDPFGEPGSRMYRVMDRVRWRADGELEYFGRTDFQVKVRGFRIEPGEIETALRAHPAVRDAVVLVREDTPGDRRLVAYVVPAEGEPTPAAAELRAHLRQHVPEYMVPGAFAVLDELPLTPNGKVDRRALPAPEQAGDESAEYLAPRDMVEMELAGVWEEVLGVSPVGIRDNFFALGGHSLLAVRLMARVETVLGARLPLATLFSAPTVESLAAVLRREGADDASPLVPVRASGDRPPLFFVHPVGGDVLCYAPLARHLSPDQPFYALRARGVAGHGSPHATIEEMAGDYVGVLREARPRGPYRLGGWSMGGVVAFEMARQLEAEGERVEVLALVDSMVPALTGRVLPEDEAVLVRTFAADLGLPLDDALLAAGGDAGTDARAYVRHVLEGAREAGLVPPDLEFEQVWRLYGIFRTHLRALYRYRPGPYGGKVALLRAAEHDPSEGVVPGWESVATAGVEVRTVPGSHFTLVREPHAVELAQALGELL